jgi:tripartite-type tricarboxylate transporter receptor subunit TctC
VRIIRLLALCVLLPALCVEAHAQAYPTKPVRMIIPFTPGGGSDVIARVLAQKLGETIGQNFVIDNRPGAGGNIAFEFVAKAEPDGYTLLNGTPGIVINPNLFRKVNYRIEDFTAVSLIGKAPLLIAVHPSLPVHTIADLVKLARAKPGAIRYGSPGAGSSSHLASEVLRMMAGIDLVHVPYKGGPQVLQDLISGQIEMTSLPLTESLPQVRANRIRALAQTGEKRSSIAPDLPTVDEAGIKGYAVTTWYVIFGPAGMPGDVVRKLNAELVNALKLADVQERLKSVGVGDIIGSTPGEAAQFVKAESVRWAEVIRASGARAD